MRLPNKFAHVLLADIRSEPYAPRAGRQQYRRFDVTSPAAWQELVDSIAPGRIDVLVNNAGITCHQAMDEVVLEDWDRVVAVNQTGPMLGMRAVVPVMRRQGGGSIINVTSSWSIVAAPGVAAYHATKGALRMMTRNAAVTYAKDRIRVNAIVPGIVRTPLTDAQPEVTESIVAMTPFGLAEPEEIGAGAVFLASDEARAVTGSDLVMDGGYTVP
jgi:NAD(P)-dependent dehydrogenase (short-subunit alcohol dehydrogenase family)